jgi:hypothetical protein
MGGMKIIIGDEKIIIGDEKFELGIGTWKVENHYGR